MSASIQTSNDARSRTDRVLSAVGSAENRSIKASLGSLTAGGRRDVAGSTQLDGGGRRAHVVMTITEPEWRQNNNHSYTKLATAAAAAAAAVVMRMRTMV